MADLKNIIPQEPAALLQAQKLQANNKGNANKISKTIFFDGESKIIFILILVSQLFLSNGFYLFASLLTLYFIIYYLQQPLKPGVFTLIALNHLLQITAAVLQANYAEKDINFRSPSMGDATIASLVGIIFMFLPIMYFQNKLPFLSLNFLKKEAQKLSIANTFNCYLVSFFATSFLSSIAFVFGGFTQVIISLVNIKWFFFLLFGYQSLLKNEKKQIFYLFVALEFVTSFFSFFSNFKLVIYFVIILLLGLLQVINLKRLIFGSVIVGCLVGFALIWTTIKTQYRSFVNGGSTEQIVSVSNEAALTKIYSLSTGVNEDSLNSSMYQLLDRLQYTFHFAKTIDRVPKVIPFTNGKNWMDNIEFVTTPRILNPNKPSLDATEKTKKYTGVAYIGRSGGASFSLGYFAECYIDFGFIGMMFPLICIGFIYGYTYWYFMRKSSNNFIFNYSVVGAFFLEFFAFEMDGTFLLGRFLSSLVTFLVLKRFFFPWILNYIKIPEPKKIPSI